MSLSDLVSHATNKERFHTVEQYIDFCARYLEYVDTGLQARIVSQNESHYQFFQYRKEGSFNITRPLNSRLMYDAEVLPELLAQVEGDIAQVAADGAYDSRACHDLLLERKASAAIPPRANAAVWEPLPDGRVHPRSAALEVIQRDGLKAWKQQIGYHRRSSTVCAGAVCCRNAARIAARIAVPSIAASGCSSFHCTMSASAPVMSPSSCTARTYRSMIRPFV